jgi:hypothetical protein
MIRQEALVPSADVSRREDAMSPVARRSLFPILAAVLLVAAVSALNGETASPRPASSVKQAADCPRNIRPLPPGAIAGATRAALAEAPDQFRGTNLRGMRAVRAARADHDDDRGGYARVACDARTQRRSVVVYLEFPAELPSASLSQGVVLMARTPSGYRTWARLH